MNYVDEQVIDLLIDTLEYESEFSYEDFCAMFEVARVLNDKYYRKPDRWITKKGKHIPIFDRDIESYVKRKLAPYTEEVKRFTQSMRSSYEMFRASRCESIEPAYKYPTSIAGVIRDEPMSFEKADNGRSNPNFHFKKEAFKYNCQCCVVAHEARMRGYNVQAVGRKMTGKTNQLAFHPYWAWLDPLINMKCEPRKIYASNAWECYEWLDHHVKQGQRYHFYFHWECVLNNNIETYGHIVVIDRDEKGRLRWYDPQSNTKLVNYKILIKLGEDAIFNNLNLKPRVLRVDDKKFNPYFINDIVQKSKF